MGALSRPGVKDVRYRRLRLLEQYPEKSQRGMSRELRFSLVAVNYMLRVLIERSEVKPHNFQTSENKLRYAYVLTPSGIAAKARLTLGFVKRKWSEYEALRAEIAALEQGPCARDRRGSSLVPLNEPPACHASAERCWDSAISHPVLGGGQKLSRSFNMSPLPLTLCLFFVATTALADTTDLMTQSDSNLETITGILVGQGVECAQFRLETGEQISLSGAVPEGAIGTLFSLEGRWAMMSSCMQGREFPVLHAVERK